MKKQLKFLSAILCLVMCTVIVFSSCIVLHRAEHNCIGEDCRVCQAIAVQKKLMESVSFCLICVFLLSHYRTSYTFLKSSISQFGSDRTPITEKVKITA